MNEDEFLEKNARLVYNLSLRLTGNPADAEDLAQESLLRALRSLSSFRGDSASATWMYRITVNTWKNRVRSEKRRKLWQMLPLHLFTGGSEGEEARETRLPAADEPEPDAGLQTEETAAVVQKALLTLDEESRAVVILRDIEGLSYHEIAEALSLPEGTVKSRLSRARSALKEKLRSYVEAA